MIGHSSITNCENVLKYFLPHHPHLCLDRLCFDQINLHLLFSGPGSPNESDFRRWIQTAKIKRNHSSPNFPSNVMGNRRFCLQRSQLRSARCAITIWILRKASQVVSQNYRWHLCAEMLRWLEFQLKGNPWLFLFWNCKLQNRPKN